MKNIKKIDLHGIRHYKVRSVLIEEIEQLWNSNTDVEIITGYSKKMKEIVKEVLDEYKLDYQEGDYFKLNNGFIKTVV